MEDGATGSSRRAGRRHGWRMCGSDTAVGWAAETGRTLHITFNSDERFNQRHVAQPDIGAWIRFARECRVDAQLITYLYYGQHEPFWGGTEALWPKYWTVAELLTVNETTTGYDVHTVFQSTLINTNRRRRGNWGQGAWSANRCWLSCSLIADCFINALHYIAL